MYLDLQGVPGEVYDIMTNPEAAITVLSPLPQDANGLLYSFQRRADLNRDEIYSIVSMHLLRETVPGSSLRANPLGKPSSFLMSSYLPNRCYRDYTSREHDGS